MPGSAAWEYGPFWSEAVRLHPDLNRSRFLEAFAFGDNERMADELAALVLQGTKRATASLVWSYEFDKKPQPKPGDLSIVTTWSRQPLCIIETTAVDVLPFEEVSEEFAKTEGEGDGTLVSWRTTHTKFFAGECARIGRTPHPRMLVVCERFRVVYQPTSRASVLIRPEAQGDADAIQAVTVAAFLDAPHTDHTEHFIVNALRASGQLAVSLVAEDNGSIVGHVAVSPVRISSGVPGWFGLGPISVLPAHQGHGIGSKLMEQALAELRKRGARGCVLVGEPRYYSRFGFKQEPSLVLPGIPPEYFQAFSLDGSLPAGTVSYHESFSAQG